MDVQDERPYERVRGYCYVVDRLISFFRSVNDTSFANDTPCRKKQQDSEWSCALSMKKKKKTKKRETNYLKRKKGKRVEGENGEKNIKKKN